MKAAAPSPAISTRCWAMSSLAREAGRTSARKRRDSEQTIATARSAEEHHAYCTGRLLDARAEDCSAHVRPFAEDEAAADEVEDGVPEDEAPAEPRRRLDPTADRSGGDRWRRRTRRRARGTGPGGLAPAEREAVGGGVRKLRDWRRRKRRRRGRRELRVRGGGGTTTGGAGASTGGAGAGTVTGGLGSGGMGTVSAKACPAVRQAHTSTVVAAATLIRQ